MSNQKVSSKKEPATVPLTVTCNRCGLPIKDLCYVLVQPALVLQRYIAQIPPIFKCKEQADNYSKSMSFHECCWMDELRDHGIKLHDIMAIAHNLQNNAIVDGGLNSRFKKTPDTRPRLRKKIARKKIKRR